MSTSDPEVGELVERTRPIGPSDRILDVGSGRVASALRERLGAAARIARVDRFGQGAGPLPFEDGAFELVLCLDLSLAAANRPALDQVWRVLARRGRFVVSTGIDVDVLGAELARSGFEEIRAYPAPSTRGHIVSARRD